ncbi:hypothetical protein PIB30_068513 [Stylosanthes scabra]|uniref:Uncharacterized protein n=1 Tax=Stylosanthes scabra TaxID=79078 RepID=A0ABU6ZLP6_9FABA|nr:hypothetical protein [Stylosanthes scabra]
MRSGLVRPDQTLFEPDRFDPIRYRASVARISLLHAAVSSIFHLRLASFRHVLASFSNATQSSFLHSSLHDNNSITDTNSPLRSFVSLPNPERYVQNCGLFTYTFDYHRLISHHLQNLNNTPWASSPTLSRSLTKPHHSPTSQAELQQTPVELKTTRSGHHTLKTASDTETDASGHRCEYQSFVESPLLNATPSFKHRIRVRSSMLKPEPDPVMRTHSVTPFT